MVSEEVMSRSLPDNFFDNFTYSFAATRLLLEKAHKEGNLIEGLVLYASIVDAVLRNLIALKTGTRKKDYIVLDNRLFFHDDKSWFNERQIYKKALNSKIITIEEFDQLNKLYTFRNKIIHRFIISPITYDDLPPRLIEYEYIYSRLYKELERIEKPQELSEDERSSIFRNIMKQIKRDW